MSDENKENLEYGLPSHEEMERTGDPITMGSSPFKFLVSGLLI